MGPLKNEIKLRKNAAIVTGEVGVGKTTVCERLVELFKMNGFSCGGIITRKNLENHQIIGIEAEDVQSGQKEPFATIRKTRDQTFPETGKYVFHSSGINFGIQSITEGLASDFLLVDEVGRLELRGEGFAQVLPLVLAGKTKAMLLIVRQSLLLNAINKFNLLIPAFKVTHLNRDIMPQMIYEYFTMDRRRNLAGLLKK